MMEWWSGGVLECWSGGVMTPASCLLNFRYGHTSRRDVVVERWKFTRFRHWTSVNYAGPELDSQVNFLFQKER